jgi:hypothetical protein
MSLLNISPSEGCHCIDWSAPGLGGGTNLTGAVGIGLSKSFQPDVEKTQNLLISYSRWLGILRPFKIGWCDTGDIWIFVAFLLHWYLILEYSRFPKRKPSYCRNII